MRLETNRLILRPWDIADAEELFRYASAPEVGPIAGWPVHTSVEDSRQVIETVLMVPETYAIIWKETNLPIGSISLKMGDATDMTNAVDECELGYWLGIPYWGRGIMPEAAEELLHHAFTDLGMSKVWCGYYDGNVKSKRVQEKCGFTYEWTTPDVDVPLMKEKRIGHVSSMTREAYSSRLHCEGVIRSV